MMTITVMLFVAGIAMGISGALVWAWGVRSGQFRDLEKTKEQLFWPDLADDSGDGAGPRTPNLGGGHDDSDRDGQTEHDDEPPQGADADERRRSLFGANAVAWFSNLLFFKPRVTYGEPSRFRIGKPEAFPLGTRLPLTRQRVTIVRTEDGIAAISNTCTHLGCVVATTEIGFDCPCHGSRFDAEGTVLGGPAPRPAPVVPGLALAERRARGRHGRRRARRNVPEGLRPTR